MPLITSAIQPGIGIGLREGSSLHATKGTYYMLHAVLTYSNLGAALVSPGSSLGRFPLAMLDAILMFTAGLRPGLLHACCMCYTCLAPSL